jgi:hypothetical protein
LSHPCLSLTAAYDTYKYISSFFLVLFFCPPSKKNRTRPYIVFPSYVCIYDLWNEHFSNNSKQVTIEEDYGGRYSGVNFVREKASRSVNNFGKGDFGDFYQ